MFLQMFQTAGSKGGGGHRKEDGVTVKVTEPIVLMVSIRSQSAVCRVQSSVWRLPNY
jgi:hypothetical protein